MSILALIASLEENGDLVPIKSRPKVRTDRIVYLTKKAWQAHNDPLSAVNILVPRAFIQAGFERWNSGFVHARMQGKKRGAFLAKLAPPPDGVWELRIYEPKPEQARVFCRFAAPDVLIATHITTRSSLGDDGSAAWSSTMGDCVNEWNKLFPGLQPFVGSHLHDYVTKKCEDIVTRHSW